MLALLVGLVVWAIGNIVFFGTTLTMTYLLLTPLRCCSSRSR